jgi:hypothetical protein
VNWGDWAVERDGGVVIVEVDAFMANAIPLDAEACQLLDGELVADETDVFAPARKVG